MKYKKNYYSILYFIIAILLIFILSYTAYAKYISGIDSNAEISVAKWNITLNGKSITSGEDLSNVVTPIFEGNSNIAPNVIAPTAEGYFDLILDASNTDVSFMYTITTSPNEDSVVKDLVISGYSIDGGEKILLDGDDIKIENSIMYDSEDKNVNIRVYLKWNDDPDSGAVMDNFEDAKATKQNGGKAKVNVNIRVVQISNN